MNISIDTNKLLKSNMSFIFDSKIKFNSQYFIFITSDGLASGLNLILRKVKEIKQKHNDVPLENIMYSCLKDIQNLCNEDFNSEVQRILKENKISNETYYFLLSNILYEIASDLSDNDDYRSMILSTIEQINISNFIRLCYNKIAKQIITTKNYEFILNINDKGYKNFYLTYVNQIINKAIYASLYEIINFDQLLNISKQYKDNNIHKMVLIHDNVLEIKKSLDEELNNIKTFINDSKEFIKTEINEQITKNIDGLYYNDKQIGDFLLGLGKQIKRLNDKIDNLFNEEEEEEKSLNIQIQRESINEDNQTKIINQQSIEEIKEKYKEHEQTYSLPKQETLNIKINKINIQDSEDEQSENKKDIEDNEQIKENEEIKDNEELEHEKELKKIDNEINRVTLKNIIEQSINKPEQIKKNKIYADEHGEETIDNIFSKL